MPRHSTRAGRLTAGNVCLRRQAALLCALSIAASLALADPPATQPPAGPKLDGAELYTDYACNSCHGERGRDGLPGNPVLAGQDQRYLLEQLLAFKRGQRANGMAQTMVGTVATLPDDELMAISAYLAAQGCR
jgi:cytochrome c553